MPPRPGKPIHVEIEPHEFFSATLADYILEHHAKELDDHRWPRWAVNEKCPLQWVTLAAWNIARRELAAIQAQEKSDPVHELTYMQLVLALQGRSSHEPWQAGIALFERNPESYSLDWLQSLVHRNQWVEANCVAKVYKSELANAKHEVKRFVEKVRPVRKGYETLNAQKSGLQKWLLRFND